VVVVVALGEAWVVVAFVEASSDGHQAVGIACGLVVAAVVKAGAQLDGRQTMGGVVLLLMGCCVKDVVAVAVLAAWVAVAVAFGKARVVVAFVEASLDEYQALGGVVVLMAGCQAWG